METEIQSYVNNRLNIQTSSFSNVEIADNDTRAVLTIPLMHEGPNKKGLYWTKKMLKEIVPLFQGIPFRYDLQGTEGSSHTVKKLSSPHFDVGWTYGSDKGAWYSNGVLWIKGEVTHPEVIEKLKRITTDGKREVNFASMGVFVESATCSICGHEYGEDGCDHIRNEKYDGKICYSVPEEIKKALHAALTNDPADAEAEITSCIFQDLSSDPSFRLTANKFENAYNQTKNMQNSINDKVVNDVNSMINPNQNSMPNGMAPGFQQTSYPGPAPSSDEIYRELAERIKTIEQHIDSQNVPPQGIPPAMPTPEVINQNQNAGATQDNMGITSQFENTQEQNMEGNNMPMTTKDGQNSNAATAINPSDTKVKAEMQDYGTGQQPAGEMQEGNKLDQILMLLQQLVGQTPQTADMGKESLDAGKENAKPAQSDLPMDHAGEGAISAEAEDAESNKKNKQHMQEPDKVATADDETAALKTELADMKAEMKTIKEKFSFQDQSLPEFGGSNNGRASLEVADMTAGERVKRFGSQEAAMDAIFNGTESAKKFLN